VTLRIRAFTMLRN